ncbi:g9133 [Coccomyxa elongata]
MTQVACALCLLFWQPAASQASASGRPPGTPSGSLDFEIEGILFHNRSLGLDHAFDVLGHQCSSGRMQPQPLADRMTYTPNRHWPANAKAARTALVVAIGGPPQRFQQHMEASWHGWRENFLARLAHSTSVIMLLDADYTDSTAELAATLELVSVDCAKHETACKAAEALDAGYTLYMVNAQEAKQPIVVLLGRAAFPAPWWISRNGSTEAQLVASGWHTPHCSTPYLVTKSLNWHAHHMFRQLRVLDYFDFWMKVGDGVRWAGNFPGDITHHLAAKHRIFFHTGLRHESDLECIGLWRHGVSKPVRLYLDSESNRCGRVLWPAAEQQPWFTDDSQVFTAEFAGGWLGFWTAPEVLSYGLIWSNFPGGAWEYRWGDQHFWKSALGIFDDGSHVEDVSYVRDGPDPNDVDDGRSHKYLNILHLG